VPDAQSVSAPQALPSLHGAQPGAAHVLPFGSHRPDAQSPLSPHAAPSAQFGEHAGGAQVSSLTPAPQPPDVRQHVPEAQSASAPQALPSLHGAQKGAAHVLLFRSHWPEAQSPLPPHAVPSAQLGAQAGGPQVSSWTPPAQPPAVRQHEPDAQSASAPQALPSLHGAQKGAAQVLVLPSH
jgi:hypothetical protein